VKSVPYLNAVGALQYLATMIRPDIAYAVSYLFFFFFFFFIKGSAMAGPLLATYLQQTSTLVVKKYLCHQMGDLNRSPKTNRNTKETNGLVQDAQTAIPCL